ncbi:hypothetical protein ACSVDA_14175 [Cytobacillus sp. Hm23]
MKKRSALLFILLVFLISTVACNKKEINNEDIQKLVWGYKKEQYTISSPYDPPTGLEISDKVNKYLSEEALNKQNESRIFELAPNLAVKLSESIELVDVIVEKGVENDDGTTDYQYTLQLKFGEDDIEEVRGELSISNKKGVKIIRDFDHFKEIWKS